MNTHCDILVVGGGVAGTAAAVAAARTGCRTVLIEREQYLGGIGYSGLLQHLCGLYVNSETEPKETLNNGIARELVSLLGKRTPQRKVVKIGQVYVLPYSRDDLQFVLGSLCSAEPSLSVFPEAEALSVESNQGVLMNVTVGRSGITQEIQPGMVIDCTGSGAVSVMAGASFDMAPPERVQLAGYIVQIRDLVNRDDSLSIKVPYYLADAVNKGKLPPFLRFTTFTPGEEPDEGFCKLSIDGQIDHDREQLARQYAETVHRYLSTVLPSFKDSRIAASSRGVMDREGRRIRGEYTLTEDDVVRGRKFPDGVAKNSWPIELWDRERGTLYRYLKPGDYYEIPLRCLTVQGFRNLLCAGRCISVSHEALGSTRVMGTCITLGEQAAVAAAHYLRHGYYPQTREKRETAKEKIT